MSYIRIKIEEKLARNTTEDQLIEELNKEEVELLIPVFIYLAFIAVAGLSGNAIVCYVYRTKFDVSSSRWFIFFIAAIDIILCAINIPLEIATTTSQYTFNSWLLCKTSTFVNLWSLLSLGFTLFIVSIDRYRKVCRPLGWQIDYFKSRCLSFGAVFVAFLLSIPVLKFYDVHSFKIHPFNFTISECSFRESASTSNFASGYILIGMVVFSSCLVMMCIFYCFVGVTIRRQLRRDSVGFSQNESLKRQSIALPGLKMCCCNKSPDKEIAVEMKKIQEPTASVNRQLFKTGYTSKEVDQSTVFSEGDKVVIKEHVESSVLNRRETTTIRQKSIGRARRATVSLFLISIIFGLSFVPFLCLLLIRSLKSGFDESLTDDIRAVYKFFLRSYFINCAINPLLYIISDAKFRRNAKSFFSRICH